MNRTSIAITVVLVVPLCVQAGKVKVWHHNSPSSYDKAEIKKLVMTSEGALRLARQIRRLAEIDVAHVGALAEDARGSLYAATGNEGKLFKIGKDGQVRLIYQSEDSEVLSLAVGANGVVYAGTGPNGQIIRVTADG